MSDRIRQELSYFFSGLSFYTRIPCPTWVKYSAENLNKSRKYLALIGLLIGAVAASTFYLMHLLLPASVSIILSMGITVYMTGAFHEDGLADCADGFGGGWEKAQILSIMKDSRLGTYGAMSLIIIVSLKFIVLWELQQVSITLMMLALVVGHSASRLMASFTMQFYDYVSAASTSKSKSVTSLKLSNLEMLWSVLPLAAVLIAIAPLKFTLAIPLLVAFTWVLGGAYKRRIGGYTGDCLGATQQLTEVFFYLIVAAKLILFESII